MLVLAFGCVHFASPAVQKELQDNEYNYENVLKLMEVIKTKKPDAVVFLGDWEEDYYEQSGWSNRLCPGLAELVTHKIKGNHDRDGLPFVAIDGWKYEHGHNNKPSWKLEDIRAFYEGKKIVHAHTHRPVNGTPLDVGSITFTGTYGIIENGVPSLEFA